MAIKKNFGANHFIVKLDWVIISKINKENNETANEPKTPDKVLLGLIVVNFPHLIVLPKSNRQYQNKYKELLPIQVCMLINNDFLWDNKLKIKLKLILNL